jgi:YfiH family protein
VKPVEHGAATRLADAIVVPDWPVPATIRAFVTTRHFDGVSEPPFDRCNLGLRSGDDREAVIENRRLVEQVLQLPSPPRWLQQVHGTTTVDVDDRLDSEEIEADAAVTRASGVVLAILSADCMPVLLATEDGSAIAIAHAGWRGLSAGVVESAVAGMRAKAERVVAWLGPAIGAASYEVGEEVRAAFVDVDASAVNAFAPTRPGHFTCDLYALARQRLAALGVVRVGGGSFDTFADARFYSYRRASRTGRFATLIYRGA